MILDDRTNSDEFWTVREVEFTDGSHVVELTAGPRNAGARVKRLGAEYKGDNERTISKAAFLAAIAAGQYTRP